MIQATKARFHPGQIVYHKVYNFRGVVFDVDPCCEADDEWFFANETQPDREQPWYHMLVDGSEQVTYVAESNLESDDNLEPVEHPLIGILVGSYDGGRYYRGLDA